MKRKYIDLCDQRSNLLEQASNYLSADNKAEYDSTMEKVTNINEDIDRVKKLLDEQERKMDAYEPTDAEKIDIAEERGSKLLNGEKITFTMQELRRGIRNIARVDNSITLATGSLALPTGVGSEIHDSLGSGVSAILDQVSVEDLTGMGALLEAYEISPIDAKSGKVTTNAGKARTASADPVFGKAKIAPFEMNVTTYVDRNISRLTRVAYYEHIYNKAMNALRKEAVRLIVNGDGQSTPDMYGLLNAKNTDGQNIFASLDSLALDAEIFDKLFFAYGGDELMSYGARVLLTKSQLNRLSKLRNDSMERVFKLSYDSASTGIIDDGGSKHPFTLVPGDGTKLMYGDPRNYKLGLFGEFSIRVDESIKGVERMVTILGDAMVGGNVVVDKGIVVGTLAEG